MKRLRTAEFATAVTHALILNSRHRDGDYAAIASSPI